MQMHSVVSNCSIHCSRSRINEYLAINSSENVTEWSSHSKMLPRDVELVSV